jgi:two-component system CheB/CheR fusion protein
MPVRIFGSDVGPAAIERARAGIYPTSIERDMPEERLRRYFTRVAGGYRIANELRELCVFSRHDLGRDPPFTRVDLIVCRNVGIPHQNIPLLHYALTESGRLVLGHGEILTGFDHLFELVDRDNRIYARKPGSSALALSSALRRMPKRVPLRELEHEVDRLLQSKYGPPAVVVDDASEIVLARGRIGRYLELPADPARPEVLGMAREGLLTDLRLALQRARGSDAPVRRVAEVRLEGVTCSVGIEVSRVRERYFLVVFDETPAVEPKLPTREPRVIQRLREEIVATKVHLQSVIDDQRTINLDLATANGELRSVNHELHSVTEELERSKQELLSANQEIGSASAEIDDRNSELARDNAELRAVLATFDTLDDVDRAIESTLALCVPRLADGARVDLLDQGTLRQVAHTDPIPAREPAVEAVRNRRVERAGG